MKVTLNRNGWHKRLQKFVFKYPPSYNSLCPFFWLTVFCFIITFLIPIVPLIKLIKLMFIGLAWSFNGTMDIIDKYFCIPLYNAMVKDLDVDHFAETYQYNFRQFKCESAEDYAEYEFWNSVYQKNGVNRSYRKDEREHVKFTTWKKLNPDWEVQLKVLKAAAMVKYQEKVKQAQENYRKEEADRIAKEKKKAENPPINKQAMFLAIVKYTKYPAIAIAIAAAAFVVTFIGYWIYRLGYWIVWHTNIHDILRGMRFIGEILLIIAVGVGFVYLIVKLCQKCLISIGDMPWINKVGQGLIWFLAVIGAGVMATGPIWIGIGSFFSFIWIYIKSTKDNYCPAIIWQDEKEEHGKGTT